MIRVLQCVNNMHRAGLETMLMNYYRNIDRTKIQFDFLTHRPERSDYDDEIEALGGKVYYAPRLYPQNYPAYFAYMKKFFREHPEYKIVHSHIDAMSYLPLLAAKRAGIPVRIAHSHNTSIDRDYKYILKQYFRSQIGTAATHCLACGKEAGVFLFQKECVPIIPNAVDCQKFLFNEEIRNSKRHQLQLGEKFVVGHVGRFTQQKNHHFLLDIAVALLQKCPDAVLLLVGKGELEDNVRKWVREKDLQDKVLFLGNRGDVNELYQAMDVFVLPSLYEGLPVVGIEAQFAGLPCILSDKVTREAEISDRCRFVSLDKSPEYWAEQILAYKETKRNETVITNPLYDVKHAHQILADYYLELYANA